jgi:carbon-monoxide dehydrogenase small subunit
MKSAAITLTLNRQLVHAQVPVQQTLLSFLRDGQNLTATKSGCNGGECGACMVLLDDEPVNSCMVLAVECDQHRVDTLEGLNETPGMQALQKAFLDEGAVQCGFCTPGMLISSYALLRIHPSPTEEQIIQAMSGNLCRCTGYQVIVQAIQRAARESLAPRGT